MRLGETRLREVPPPLTLICYDFKGARQGPMVGELEVLLILERK